MNVELIEQLATMLEQKAFAPNFYWHFPIIAENVQRYNAERDTVYHSAHPCGTLGCAIGAGALVGLFGEEIKALFEMEVDPKNYSTDIKVDTRYGKRLREIAKLLSMPYHDFETIFLAATAYPCALHRVKPEHVALRLRDYLEHKYARETIVLWPDGSSYY